MKNDEYNRTEMLRADVMISGKWFRVMKCFDWENDYRAEVTVRISRFPWFPLDLTLDLIEETREHLDNGYGEALPVTLKTKHYD